MRPTCVFILLLCLRWNLSHGQDVVHDGTDGGNLFFPDQFINMLDDGQFVCPECTKDNTFLGYEQAAYADRINAQWIAYMEHKLLDMGFPLYPPPPIIVNWFEFDNIAQSNDGGVPKMGFNAETMMQSDFRGNEVEEPKKPNFETKIGKVLGVSLASTVEDLGVVDQRAEMAGGLPVKLFNEFETLPKIETKQDMIAARKKANENGMEGDVFFIFFHNEADMSNRRIKKYTDVKNKYSTFANFYRTDTGFALFWAEKLDIYRVFDTVVAVHPQNGYHERNDNPTVKERTTYLPIEYQYYDQFVQLQHGSADNFIRLHLDAGEVATGRSDGTEFPHVLYTH